LATKAKDLSVRPAPDQYRLLKDHLKILKWLESGDPKKPLLIEMIESRLDLINNDKANLCREKIQKARNMIAERLSPHIENIRVNCHWIEDVKKEFFQFDKVLKQV
jgi:hypothetical protein